jgi:hypothetical protein
LLGASSSPVVSNAMGLQKSIGFVYCGSARLHADLD